MMKTNKRVTSVATCTFARKPYWPSIRVLTISSMVTFDFNTMLVNILYKNNLQSRSTQTGSFKKFYEGVTRYYIWNNHNQCTSTQQTLLISLSLVMTVPGARRLYEFLTLTGISPSLAGRID